MVRNPRSRVPADDAPSRWRGPSRRPSWPNPHRSRCRSRSSLVSLSFGPSPSRADPMPKAYRRSKARVGLKWAWKRPFKGLSPKEAETSKNRLRLVYGTIPENRSEGGLGMMKRWALKSPSKGLC